MSRKFVDVDYSQLETRVLAAMSDKERQQALCAAYGGGQVKQALVVGEYPPPDVLAQLEQIGIRGTARLSRSEPALHEVPVAWKPSFKGEEPPF